MLDRQFQADMSNRKWVADFTYIWTAEGWLYVAVVLGSSSCSREDASGESKRAAILLRWRELSRWSVRPNLSLNRTRNGMSPSVLISFWPCGAMPPRAG